MPINRVPKRIWGVVFGTPFWGICDWYLTFSYPKHGPGAAPDRPDSVCLISDVTLFSETRFGAGRWTYNSVFRKELLENGVPPGMRRRDGPFSVPPCRGRCTLLKWRLRRAPLLGLFGWLGATQLVTCTCGATCPRGFLSSFERKRENRDFCKKILQNQNKNS